MTIQKSDAINQFINRKFCSVGRCRLLGSKQVDFSEVADVAIVIKDMLLISDVVECVRKAATTVPQYEAINSIGIYWFAGDEQHVLEKLNQWIDKCRLR